MESERWLICGWFLYSVGMSGIECERFTANLSCFLAGWTMLHYSGAGSYEVLNTVPLARNRSVELPFSHSYQSPILLPSRAQTVASHQPRGSARAPRRLRACLGRHDVRCA